jgi:hypothetical protein
MLYILRLLRSSNNLGLDWRDRQWPLKAKLRETTVNTDQENRGTRRGTKKGPPTPVVKTWLLKGADQTGRAKIPSSGGDSELQRLWWWGPEKVASMNGLNAVAEVGKDGNSKEAEMRRPQSTAAGGGAGHEVEAGNKSGFPTQVKLQTGLPRSSPPCRGVLLAACLLASMNSKQFHFASDSLMLIVGDVGQRPHNISSTKPHSRLKALKIWTDGLTFVFNYAFPQENGGPIDAGGLIRVGGLANAKDPICTRGLDNAEGPIHTGGR